MKIGKEAWKSVRDGKITSENARRPEEILALVRLGKMTPNEAESWAEREGMPPIAGRPDPSAFDPMTRPSWTPLQAVAWIAYRDVEKVRDASAEFRAQWSVWREVAEPDDDWTQPKRGSWLEPVPAASFLESFDDDALAEAKEADLIASLIAGDVTCSGFMNSGGQRVIVPPIQWNDLKFHFGADDVALVSMWQSTPIASVVHYTDLLIERERVLKLWPAQPPENVAGDAVPTGKKSLNERKREATIRAMHGISAAGTQFDTVKLRENAIVGLVLQVDKLKISPRYVRKLTTNTRNRAGS